MDVAVLGHAVFILTGFSGLATTNSRGNYLLGGLPGNALGASVEMVLGVLEVGR